jgi:hypothetical protein
MKLDFRWLKKNKRKILQVRVGNFYTKTIKWWKPWDVETELIWSKWYSVPEVDEDKIED